MKKVADRIIGPPVNQNVQPFDGQLQEAVQNLRHVDVEPAIAPRNEAQEEFIRSLQDMAQNLKPVAGYNE